MNRKPNKTIKHIDIAGQHNEYNNTCRCKFNKEKIYSEAKLNLTV